MRLTRDRRCRLGFLVLGLGVALSAPSVAQALAVTYLLLPDSKIRTPRFQSEPLSGFFVLDDGLEPGTICIGCDLYQSQVTDLAFSSESWHLAFPAPILFEGHFLGADGTLARFHPSAGARFRASGGVRELSRSDSELQYESQTLLLRPTNFATWTPGVRPGLPGSMVLELDLFPEHVTCRKVFVGGLSCLHDSGNRLATVFVYAAPVPEPSSALLFAGGLLALGLSPRRRG